MFEIKNSAPGVLPGLEKKNANERGGMAMWSLTPGISRCLFPCEGAHMSKA